MGSPFELATDRLSIRMLQRSDITEFTRYRNIADVARFQDWPLPYTRDHAHALVDGQEASRAPARGSWSQLAMLCDGRLVGDLAVWLDEPGALAMIGFTVAPESQGQGYATEAAGVLVDYLFGRRRVHRIAATLDPRNLASATVLERCGFRHIGIARSAALIRGEWCDDSRYELVHGDWADRRRQGPVCDIALVEVTSDNVADACALATSPSQRRFVAPVAVSIAQAAHPGFHDGEPVEAWYRAIAADGELAGFAMVARPTTRHPKPYLWRFMIDRRFQRRGVGRRAIVTLAGELVAQGHTELELSVVDEPGGPEPFYRSLGFRRTGEVDSESGEIMMSASLDDLRARGIDQPTSRRRSSS